ncbi:short-chain dehydrogenase [Acidithiobacillus thiooxidans]|uniref:Short-chain dehydrogenase n=1 Tax=Acidithiobacillus thiooxidans TaxID=930 RepID=A0A1C2JID7_ACITH|nr:SDR family NAD(P)-dependent oxidoreductase [Acidithiobacillus thiooxidans]OCX74648.1 short-chain dehydrogenase [Acidithiobacillus thiooxidans]OCX76324.1 short-chain dehydrogenase [Acidithiobacillus thiooxidans]OCX77103.1 short-chain dehydrogenase [Acidithiobacillus thiooxidans]OCX83308.1 short-chain dehydrogenase [Acidithiobacillus thiooxidans]OCX84632.1 short-chain dehydrogenase [Acidithiobacillus thiooxidans]
MSDKSYWQGKRCWLIGASTGIGAACAAALNAQGARLALTARNPAKLADLAAKLGNDNTLVCPADVTTPDELHKAYTDIREQWGGLDVLMFLAGTYQAARSWELNPDQARQAISTNYLGAVDAVHTVLADWLAAGQGQIVLTSSVAGLRGLPQSLYYGPSKAALTHFAEVLHLDLEPKGIKVQVIHPGFVATPLTAHNDFPMPNLISPEQAATEILAGMENKAFEIHFPRAFTRKLKFLRCLPYRWYFSLIHRFTGL